MNDIFDEAEKEIKHIKKIKLIKTGAYIFLFLSIVAVLTTGIYKWNENRFNKKVLLESDMFLAIVGEDKDQLSEADILKLNEIAQRDDTNFSALSYLIIAKKNYDNENYENFTSNMEKIILNKSFDVVIRDFAVLDLSNYYLAKNLTEQAFEKINAVNLDSSPYRDLLKLNLALVLIKQNKTNESKAILSSIIAQEHVPSKIIEDSRAALYLIEKMEKNA